MATDPSFRLELDTATALRDWLLDASHRDTTDTVVAESLAELAAGIDGQLHGQSEYLEIGVSTTKFPPTNSSPAPDDQSEISETADPSGQDTDAAGYPAERSSVDTDTDPSQVYDTLPDDAWRPPTEEDAAPSEQSSTSTNDHEQAPTATAGCNRSNSEDSTAFQFVTSYECEVCGAIQEMETSLQVLCIHRRLCGLRRGRRPVQCSRNPGTNLGTLSSRCRHSFVARSSARSSSARIAVKRTIRPRIHPSGTMTTASPSWRRSRSLSAIGCVSSWSSWRPTDRRGHVRGRIGAVPHGQSATGRIRRSLHRRPA